MQGVFPAGVVVFQGTSFARFDQAGSVVAGSAPLLADGLDAAEVPGLLPLGSPAAPPAALTQLRADRVTVVLPPGFAAGAASVVLYAVYQDQGFASNTRLGDPAMTRARRLLLAVLLVVSARAAYAQLPVFAGDPVNPSTGAPYIILPGVPLVDPGPDGTVRQRRRPDRPEHRRRRRPGRPHRRRLCGRRRSPRRTRASRRRPAVTVGGTATASGRDRHRPGHPLRRQAAVRHRQPADRSRAGRPPAARDRLRRSRRRRLHRSDRGRRRRRRRDRAPGDSRSRRVVPPPRSPTASPPARLR